MRRWIAIRLLSMKPIFIVQNDAVEGAGRFSSQISDRNVERHIVLGFEADYAGLSSKDYAGLVLLGGAQGAYETERYPYLAAEIALCQDFLSEGKPVIGLCLGAQLLASAVGGTVEPGEHKEIGWHDLTLTDAAADDPLLRGHPKTLVAYHFHGDCIRDAPGATTLASSVLTPIQLFRYGANAYGFQYHAEVDQALLELMCRNNSDYLDTNDVEPRTMIDEAPRFLPAFERHCRIVLDRWLDLTASGA